MAKKHHRLEVTPLLGLSMMAIIVMMIPIFALSRNKPSTPAKAKEVMEMEKMDNETPSPSPASRY